LKILIIENEVYLAQSIATKLTELGHICETCTSLRDALKEKDFEVVLLSTSLNNHDLTPIIETFKDSIVILMVSYISNDTVSKPLSAGAKDYIVKPFMIEELVRKINHHQDYERLKKQSINIEKYLDYTFKNEDDGFDFTNISFPLFITSSSQKKIDSYVYFYSKKEKEAFEFINLEEQDAFDIINKTSDSTLLYIINYHLLKKQEKKEFAEIIKNKKAFISSLENIEENNFKTIELLSQTNIFTHSDILPIEDYVKYIVINYQHKFPDTELSKKLGISRKSLWEKRKKYDIIKKK